MSISLAGLPTTASIGVPYSGSFTCTAGASPLFQASGATCSLAGLPAGLTVGTCTPVPPATVAAGGTIVCPVSGTPTAIGSSTATGTTGATNDNNAGNNTATRAIVVTGSNMTPDLTGLPTTASIGVPYTGTIRCTNSATATASATAATCSVSGLPAGVTVGACTPVPPATVAAGASISCPVSGTPTAVGSSTVVVTTGATNDTNCGTTTGGDNRATSPITTTGSDMVPDVSGLPTSASIGVPYTGTLRCTNSATATASATAATCAVSGLPPGVTIGACTPTPPATVAAGASISCPVSGTPTALGATTLTATTLTATTGATNDINGGTSAGGNNSTTAGITTTGSDMTPDLTGLPATATVGTPYVGTIRCTNSATATASATAASCSVTGLPPGVTVGTCTPTPPATVAANASISCPVSGTPTANGSSTVTVTTGATNDTNGGTTSGGNNQATQGITASGSDMIISLSGLPTTGGIGQPYSGTFTCTNVAPTAVTATAASCSVAGLPVGLTTLCSPTPPTAVAQGNAITCSVTGTPTASGTSTVNGTTGATNDGNSANNTAVTSIAIGTPALSIVKATTTANFSAVGTVVPYTFTVTNAGTITIVSAITVSDSRIASVSCPALPGGILVAGGSIVCSGSYTTTQADLDAGSVVNAASASSGSTTSPTDIHTLPAVQTRGLTIAKTPTPSTFNAPGTVISYSYLVRNTGNTTIPPGQPVTVADDKIATVSCPAIPVGGLAPNATLTCSATYSTTQADMDAGLVVNVASATSGPTTSLNTTATATAIQSPALAIAKDTTASGFSAVGVAVPYTFTVTNVGNTTLTSAITVSDSKIASVTCPALPGGVLAPSASITCTGTYSTTQADLDAGSIVNTASATSGVVVSPTANHSLPANITHSLVLTKTPSPTTFAAPGVAISYTYVVRNTGNATIPASTAISVSDDKLASVTCPAIPVGGIAPNATLTCTGSHTTTQADVDAGSITNIASATDGTAISPPVSATVNATQSPAMTIAKSTPATTYATVGQVIAYSFTVTNTGNVTLTSAVTVTDSKIASVSCPALPGGRLAPAAFITCTGSYTITQADLDAGLVGNTASATSGTTTSPPDDHTLPATQTRALTIVKSSTLANFAATGVAIPYSYRVTNTGNVTLTSAVSVADDKIASVSCPGLPVGGLAPGAFVTCTGTYTTVQADLNAGGVTNIATAASGSTTSPSTTLTVPAVQTRALSIAKSANVTSISTVGQSVLYSYLVTNTGNVTLTSGVSVADNKIASVVCPALPVGGLAPGAFITCSATYAVTQSDLDAGSVTNIALATSGSTTSPQTSVTVPSALTPSLAIVKSTTSPSFTAVGTVLTYSYRVTNTGNATFTNPVTVNDDKIASVTCPALPGGVLAPGAFITCSASYTTTQADVDAGGVTNIASATSGATTSAPTNLTITSTRTPGLSLVKATTAATYAAAGDTVPYTYVVTNTGNTTLTTAVTVTDSKISPVSCPALPVGGLVPGGSITCTATYTVVQADVDGGNIVNLAQASSGPVTSPTVTYDLRGQQDPKLTISKASTTTAITTSGQIVPYTYTATNTGNVTLTVPITIADNKIASVTCPPIGAGLVPGASITCNGSYTVTQADLDAGSVVNTAVGASGTPGTPINSNTVALTIPVTRSPALSMIKSAPSAPYAAVGQVVTYSFAVTNSGNVTITVPVTIADDKIASVTCPALPVGGLAPAGSLTCTGTYTVTQADLDAGSVVNTATAQSGPTISTPPQVHTQTGSQVRSLSLVKASSTASYATVGAAVSYTYTVRNTGNVTVPSGATISIADDKIATVSCPALPGAGLAPNATLTCSATHTVTQADIDAGSIVNNATATDGTATSNVSTVTVPAVRSPMLSLVKSTTTTSFAGTGVAVPYTFVVTNAGNTTLTAAITVSDSRIASVSCPALPLLGLAPGGTITCAGTYTTTQADLNAGSVFNTATATSGSTTSPTASHTLPAAQNRALTLVKTASPTTYAATGVTVSYSYVVTNSGNITIPAGSPISVSDNRIASVTCPALPVGGLVPGATLTCSAVHVITQADLDAGSITNTATATDGTVTSPVTSATVTASQSPALAIVKATTATTYSTVGQVIPYTFTATNTGNVTLTGAVSVTDNRIAAVSCPALPVGGLAPAASIVCTGSHTITQADVDAGSVTNTAFARSGTTTSTPPVVHTLTGSQTRSIAIVKSTTTTTFAAPGVVIPYSYRVTNTGNVTLTSTVNVSDDKIASVSCPALPVGGLAPGAFITCSGSYTTVQADVDAGRVTNIALATSGSTTSLTATVTVNASLAPALTVVKSSTTTSFATVGVVIPYSYRVTNSGNTTLTAAITVADNKIASVSCPALPVGGLAPGASINCSGSYTTVQADIDAGRVTNLATATSGTTISPTVTLTINAVLSPSLTIVKSSTTTSFATPGVVIPYSYRVTNSGNVTLTSAVTVADNKIASVSCPALPGGVLVPGAFIVCTGSYTTVQADVDAGRVTNLATATSGTTISPTVGLTINAALAPALTIVKSSTTTSFATPGVAIPYSYRVTNTGNTTLTVAVTVTDNKIASVSCPALPVGGLAPGAFITCTATYTTTQADVDAGQVTNIASAASGPTTSLPATLTIISTRTPALTIVKSSTVTTFSAVGTVIPYSYRVTNSGNTTLTAAVTVTDDKIASVSCPALPVGGLLPAAFITCTGSYTTTQADIDAGRVTNIASATSGTVTSPTATVTINATQSPALTLVKSTTATTFAATGTVIPYSYRVTNSGNTTLTIAVTVADDKIASVTCPALPVGGLVPGAFITCAGSYTTTQADLDAGRVTNIASATSGTVTSPTATVTVNGAQTPALTVIKSSTTTIFTAAGTVIPYSYAVTNSGNTTLTAAVTVTDDRIASVTCPALPVGGLVPGASITCSGSYTTTQADVDAGRVTNIASATSGTTSSPPVTVTILSTQTPALVIAKSTTTTAFAAAGTVIPYSYIVTNAGNVTLTAAVTVADDKIAAVACPALPVGGLVPGAVMTCTGSYTTTQADVDAGRVTNIATATSGPTTSPPVTVTVVATRTPALTLVKATTTTAFSVVGAVIPYTYTITNSGNTTLTTAITVADDKIASVSCPALPVGGLIPGAAITCTGTYTTTQADLDAGRVTNIATATSGTITSPPVTVTVTASQTPALSVGKSTTTTTFSAVGTVIPYSYRVTNTGNTTLTTAITVADDKIASVPCPALPVGGLVPGAFITCTGSYTTTQADLDAGRVTNIATATSGPTTSPPVTVTVVATQTPGLTVVKAATVATYVAVGDVIPYTYRVTNTGNTTLTAAVTVADDRIATVTCPALPGGGLVPGGAITCSATYTVTQADLDFGSVTNLASATSGTVVSPEVSVTVTGEQRPDFAVVKATLSSTAVNNGDGTFTATFSIAMTNVGNVNLIDVQMVDDYNAQLPAGARVTAAAIRSIASSVRGALTTANAAYTATSAAPNLLVGAGESLSVGETITAVIDIRFDPGNNPSGSSFANTVVAETVFNKSTPIAVSASRTSVATVPFVANRPLLVAKTSPKTDIVKGELVPYTITVRNADTVTRTNLTVIDRIPAGFTYKPGTATINGVSRTPTINGNLLVFANLTVDPRTPLVLKLMLIAGAGLGAGEFTNEAWVLDADGNVGSNVGKATVRMVGDPTFDCTDIIGKVFDDANTNGYQDEGERGIANVRVVTVRGQIITTDSEGRYHIACADIPQSERGTNFILKLDVRSLPTGYRVTTENPRVIRITAGKMAKINFGAAGLRVARLDLSSAAFEAGTVTLKPKWAGRMGPVIAALAKDKSVLRIAYRRLPGESSASAHDRIKAMQDYLEKAWLQAGAPYQLAIETEVYERSRP